MVLASVFFSFMGAMVNQAQILEPQGSPLVASFVRLLVNIIVVASVAQYFLTAAYQQAPAALNAAVSYVTPVLNLGWSVWFFGRHPDGTALAGACMVLICGVALPVISVSARKKASKPVSMDSPLF